MTQSRDQKEPRKQVDIGGNSKCKGPEVDVLGPFHQELGGPCVWNRVYEGRVVEREVREMAAWR